MGLSFSATDVDITRNTGWLFPDRARSCSCSSASRSARSEPWSAPAAASSSLPSCSSSTRTIRHRPQLDQHRGRLLQRPLGLCRLRTPTKDRPPRRRHPRRRDAPRLDRRRAPCQPRSETSLRHRHGRRPCAPRALAALLEVPAAPHPVPATPTEYSSTPLAIATIHVPMLPGVLLSLVIGFVSSFLGIGGGVIHVPVMSQLLGFPVHIATPPRTSCSRS